MTDLDRLLELISEDLDGYTLDVISQKMQVIDSLKKEIEEKLEGKK